MKRSTFIACAAATISLLTLSGTALAQTTLRLGHNISATSPYQVGAEAFAKAVAERTQGRVRVQIFPSGALGNERDMNEGIQLGTVDLGITSTAALGSFVPALQVLDVPFLFRNYAHARAVIDGPIGAELTKAINEKNLEALALGEIGFRHISASKRINAPDDLKGIKLRSQNNPVHLAAWRTLGAQPTVVGFTELYAALQSGVVDANEQPLSIHLSSKFFEVQKHLTLTNHIYGAAVLLASPSTMRRLSPADQEAVRAAAREAVAPMRRAVDTQDAAAIGALRQAGMTVHESFDRAAFERTLADFKVQQGATLGVERIRAIQNTR
jgi:tripartite ATP-independent transporter DctP family solute receptor